MDKNQLGPVAEILIPAYMETAGFSRQFRDDHGQPPTLAAKVHHMRAVAQAMVNKSERLALGDAFSEFGRVEITDPETERCYVLRSDGALAIEQSKRQSALFDNTSYLRTDVLLLVYRFHRDGLDLSLAGAHQRAGRKRLEASGPAVFIGTWPYAVADETKPFEQGKQDPFSELGDLPEAEEGDNG